MTKDLYTIRQMTKEEIPLAVEWAAREGWNPGLYDAPCFYATDPTGFLIGELDGKMIACKSAVKYGDDFGFMGFYMVAPEYRGKGYGYEIWKRGHDSLTGRIAGMDGVVEQQPNYRKSGYRLAYRNIRMEGKGTGMSVENVHLIPASEVSFDSLVKYDRQYFPAERSKFLECWIHQPESLALTYVEKGSILGFGMIRKCRIGYKIGPLFSESENIANFLSGALFGFPHEGEPVFVDIPEPSEAAHRLVERYKMKKVFETARMYFGPPPVQNIGHVYGITTFELG